MKYLSRIILAAFSHEGFWNKGDNIKEEQTKIKQEKTKNYHGNKDKFRDKLHQPNN